MTAKKNTEVSEAVQNETAQLVETDKDTVIQKLREEIETLKGKTAEATTAVAMNPATEEKRVKIKLFKDSKDYKDDLTVGINGKIYQIRRGVEVEVPESVYEIIQNSAAQDQKTAEMIERLVAETEAKEKEM